MNYMVSTYNDTLLQLLQPNSLLRQRRQCLLKRLPRLRSGWWKYGSASTKNTLSGNRCSADAQRCLKTRPLTLSQCCHWCVTSIHRTGVTYDHHHLTAAFQANLYQPVPFGFHLVVLEQNLSGKWHRFLRALMLLLSLNPLRHWKNEQLGIFVKNTAVKYVMNVDQRQ